MQSRSRGRDFFHHILTPSVFRYCTYGKPYTFPNLTASLFKFQQSQPAEKLDGEGFGQNSERNPYDASKTGPLCPQVTILSEPVSQITRIKIQPNIERVIKLIIPVSDRLSFMLICTSWVPHFRMRLRTRMK